MLKIIYSYIYMKIGINVTFFICCFLFATNNLCKYQQPTIKLIIYFLQQFKHF